MRATNNSEWRVEHAAKLVDARSAIAHIRPGRRILIGSGAAEPVALVDALATCGDHLADNEIVHILTLGPAPYVKPEAAARFRHKAFFIGPNVRDAVQEGRADFVPVFLSEIPELFRSRRVRIDVALVQVSPPDRHGFVSLGVSVDVVRAAVNSAELVIAQVNPFMPRTHGDSFVHVSRIDYLVAHEEPLLELSSEQPGELEGEIGRNVATLVPNGATLQTGIGGIPNAVMRELVSRKDLGVHTEMLSNGVMDLALSGAITGKAKTLLPGKLVTSFIMGDARLYEWVHDNPAIEMRASDFTNDPWVIARNDRMTSINSALAVDLTGQVASDTLLGKFFSGIGGQVDFVRGAARSRDGKSIIALPSTAKSGTVSRIQAALDPGAGVVTSRGDVRYVVTEHGVADLWGKSIRERATALIAIAHPDFRRELSEGAKQRRYIFPDQRFSSAAYPWQEERQERLRDGARVVIRPVQITDQEQLQSYLYSLSDETIYRRYMAHKRTHPREELQELVDVDYQNSMAVVAREAAHDTLIAIARYDVDLATGLADVAFSVHDQWQGRGLGKALFKRMAEIAYSRGIAGFCADVLASNTPMLRVFHRSGHNITSTLEHGVYHMDVLFDSDRARDRGVDMEAKSRASRPPVR